VSMGSPGEGAAILALGDFLPPLRFNDWWADDVVAGWRGRGGLTDPSPPPDLQVTEGMERTLRAMSDWIRDPFRGVVSRPVMPEGMLTSDMERMAAEVALERAGVDPGSVDFVLQQSSANDYISPQNACLVHRDLGLRRDCLTLGVEGGCDSFALQLTTADAILRAGLGSTGLLIQSSANSRLVSPGAPYAPWFGDGATAAVVGRASPGHGILGRCHQTDGDFFYSNGVGGEGAPWYDGGRARILVDDPRMMRRLLLTISDLARVTMSVALEDAALAPDDVDFYACHQATVWLGDVTKERAGLHRARTVNTCGKLGSVGACNVPLVLIQGLRARQLDRGDLVALHAGGAGMTYSSMVLRWEGAGIE